MPEVVHVLPRIAVGGAVPAVVEDHHVQPGRGEAFGERLEPRVLRGTEAVAHDHARPATRTGELVVLCGEVPGGAAGAVAVEVELGSHSPSLPCADAEDQGVSSSRAASGRLRQNLAPPESPS